MSFRSRDVAPATAESVDELLSGTYSGSLTTPSPKGMPGLSFDGIPLSGEASRRSHLEASLGQGSTYAGLRGSFRRGGSAVIPPQSAAKDSHHEEANLPRFNSIPVMRPIPLQPCRLAPSPIVQSFPFNATVSYHPYSQGDDLERGGDADDSPCLLTTRRLPFSVERTKRKLLTSLMYVEDLHESGDLGGCIASAQAFIASIGAGDFEKDSQDLLSEEGADSADGCCFPGHLELVARALLCMSSCMCQQADVVMAREALLLLWATIEGKEDEATAAKEDTFKTHIDSQRVYHHYAKGAKAAGVALPNAAKHHYANRPTTVTHKAMNAKVLIDALNATVAEAEGRGEGEEGLNAPHTAAEQFPPLKRVAIPTSGEGTYPSPSEYDSGGLPRTYVSLLNQQGVFSKVDSGLRLPLHGTRPMSLNGSAFCSNTSTLTQWRARYEQAVGEWHVAAGEQEEAVYRLGNAWRLLAYLYGLNSTSCLGPLLAIAELHIQLSQDAYAAQLLTHVELQLSGKELATGTASVITDWAKVRRLQALLAAKHHRISPAQMLLREVIGKMEEVLYLYTIGLEVRENARMVDQIRRELRDPLADASPTRGATEVEGTAIADEDLTAFACNRTKFILELGVCHLQCSELESCDDEGKGASAIGVAFKRFHRGYQLLAEYLPHLHPQLVKAQIKLSRLFIKRAVTDKTVLPPGGTSDSPSQPSAWGFYSYHNSSLLSAEGSQLNTSTVSQDSSRRSTGSSKVPSQVAVVPLLLAPSIKSLGNTTTGLDGNEYEEDDVMPYLPVNESFSRATRVLDGLILAISEGLRRGLQLHHLRVDVLEAYADMLCDRGEPLSASVYCGEALETAQLLYTENHRRCTELQQKLLLFEIHILESFTSGAAAAESLRNATRLPDASECERKLNDLFVSCEMSDRNPTNLIELRYRMGVVCAIDGRYAQSLRYHQDALVRCDRQLIAAKATSTANGAEGHEAAAAMARNINTLKASILGAMAASYSSASDVPNALRCLSSALIAYSQGKGPVHIEVAAVHARMAELYLLLNRHRDAISSAELCIATVLKALSDRLIHLPPAIPADLHRRLTTMGGGIFAGDAIVVGSTPVTSLRMPKERVQEELLNYLALTHPCFRAASRAKAEALRRLKRR